MSSGVAGALIGYGEGGTYVLVCEISARLNLTYPCLNMPVM